MMNEISGRLILRRMWGEYEDELGETHFRPLDEVEIARVKKVACDVKNMFWVVTPPVGREGERKDEEAYSITKH